MHSSRIKLLGISGLIACLSFVVWFYTQEKKPIEAKAAKKEDPKAIFPEAIVKWQDSATTLEPISAGVTPWQGKVKLTTNGTMSLTLTRTIWTDGKPSTVGSGASMIHSGEVSLTAVPPKDKNGKEGTLIWTYSIATGSQKFAWPKLGNQRTFMLPEKIVVKDGDVIPVLALTAGKTDEGLTRLLADDEMAKRCEWAATVTLTFHRRKDSHRIGLTNLEGQAVLSYAGTSLKKAIEEGKNVAEAKAVNALAQAVKVEPKDPCKGTVTFSGINAEVPEHVHHHSGGLEGLGLPGLSMERADAESEAWELTAESRAVLKKLVGIH